MFSINSQRMKNLYKNKEIFICKHDIHQHFSSQMSVYHVLEDKNCYPDGCIYFKWKCKILAKKKKCHRNFSFVGKECFSCQYFFEEKIHQYPQIQLNDSEKNSFLSDYDDFIDWIHEIKNQRILCEGKVYSIRPNFTIRFNNQKLIPDINGFLVTFEEGFIQNILFEDRFFLHISADLQNKLRIRREDEIEFQADLKVKKGKFEFFKPGKINFYLRGTDRAPTKSEALVSLNTATLFNDQPIKCKQCQYSILPEIQGKTSGVKRALICTKGIVDDNYCTINLDLDGDKPEECANKDWNKSYCSKTI